jgi:hypothetical protein
MQPLRSPSTSSTRLEADQRQGAHLDTNRRINQQCSLLSLSDGMAHIQQAPRAAQHKALISVE